MSKNLSLRHEELDDIGREIRKTILPSLNANLHTAIDTLVAQQHPPVILFADKPLSEVETMISDFKHKLATELRFEVKERLTDMLLDDSTENLIDSTDTNEQAAAVASPDTEVAASTTSKRFEPPFIEIPLSSASEPASESEPLPLSVIRDIIKERVSSKDITTIVFAAADGQTPDEIKAQSNSNGIKSLGADVIEVIIEDNDHRIKGIHKKRESRKNDTPPSVDTPAQAVDETAGNEVNDYSTREVKRMYKRGYTTAYILSETGLTSDEIEEITKELTLEDTHPTTAALAMMSGMQDKNSTLETIAEECQIRPEVVSRFLNGSH